MGEYNVLIMFDVRNAFNTARWDFIEERARRKIDEGDDYNQELLGRNKNTGGKELSLDQTMVVPQRLVLGSLLWNIFWQ